MSNDRLEMSVAATKHAVDRRQSILPAGLRGPEAAHYCGLSLASWKRATSAGRTPAPIRLNGCVLWHRETLDLWLRLGAPPRDEFEAMIATEKGGRR
jgi:hypothetical protein